MSSKFHPILFSALMVNALPDGKTITRRTRRLENINPLATEIVRSSAWRKQGDFIAKYRINPGDDDPKRWHVTNVIKCPYGKPGDILWVRETFFKNGEEYIYLADGTCCEQFEQCECEEIGKPKWKPSIHMPKIACRIWLKINDIRVERLHDITDEDCLSEGIYHTPDNAIPGFIYEDDYDGKSGIAATPKIAFKGLWMSINGIESWLSNPWVWVIKFEQINKPENF